MPPTVISSPLSVSVSLFVIEGFLVVADTVGQLAFHFALPTLTHSPEVVLSDLPLLL